MNKEVTEKVVILEQLERKRVKMEDEIFLWKQKRYQLEDLESDMTKLGMMEQELITLSLDSWSGNTGQRVAGYMEEQHMEQKRVLKKDINSLREATIQLETNARKELLQLEKEQQKLHKEVYQ